MPPTNCALPAGARILIHASLEGTNQWNIAPPGPSTSGASTWDTWGSSLTPDTRVQSCLQTTSGASTSGKGQIQRWLVTEWRGGLRAAAGGQPALQWAHLPSCTVSTQEGRSPTAVRAAKFPPGGKKKTKRTAQTSSPSSAPPLAPPPPPPADTDRSSPRPRADSASRVSQLSGSGSRARGASDGRSSRGFQDSGADEGAEREGGRESAGPGPVASRERVLAACTLTSGAMAAAGLLLRQASHLAAEAGWPLPDCTLLMPYSFASWHVAVGAALVVGVSGLRLLLLQRWPAFASASDASNRQVLLNLEPWDLLWVAALPGISEEVLFRGALLPLVAPDWRGVLVAGAVFGALHVGGNRNTAFALWAAMVGMAYGAAAVATSDLAVPIAAHSLANLLAAAAWKGRDSKAGA